jgi:hypothetical protein
MPIVEGGRATRSESLRKWNGDLPQVVPSQQTERYQAVTETNPMIFGPVAQPLAWRRATPLIAAFVVACVGLFVPREFQLGIAAGLCIFALAALWRVL